VENELHAGTADLTHCRAENRFQKKKILLIFFNLKIKLLGVLVVEFQLFCGHVNDKKIVKLKLNDYLT